MLKWTLYTIIKENISIMYIMDAYSTDSSNDSSSSDEEQLERNTKSKTPKSPATPAVDEPKEKTKRVYNKKPRSEEELAVIKSKRLEILAKAREKRSANQAEKKEVAKKLKEEKVVAKAEKKKSKKETIVNNHYYYGDKPSEKKELKLEVKAPKARPHALAPVKKIMFV
jgi:hypothetical protein